jgi:hypothetical protein
MVLAQCGVREWWGCVTTEHERAGLLNGGAAFAIEIEGVLAGWLGYDEELDPDYRHASLDIFPAPEQDRNDVELQLVDYAGGGCLPDGGGAARDVDAVLARGFTRLGVGGVEAVGDEVKARSALHLDRLVGAVREYEHRCVVRRLGPLPAAPLLIPLVADRSEHVAPHDVGAARTQQPALGLLVGVVGAFVAELPAVDLATALAERVLSALIRPGDEAVCRC